MEGQASDPDHSNVPESEMHQAVSGDGATNNTDGVPTAQSVPNPIQFVHHPNCRHANINDNIFMIIELSKVQVFFLIGLISTAVVVASIVVAIYVHTPSHFNGDPMVG